MKRINLDNIILKQLSSYTTSKLCLLIKKYHNPVETSIIIPPVIDVINDVFKPFIKICGEILLISETELKALSIPI